MKTRKPEAELLVNERVSTYPVAPLLSVAVAMRVAQQAEPVSKIRKKDSQS